MSSAEFIYVVYIASTPEKIWNALLVPEITRQYWNHENVSDWKVGSSWEHRRADESRNVVILGRVVEVIPFKHLVLTWALPKDVDDKSKYTRATFDIEAVATMARLTVTHDELEEGSEMLRSITAGWPRVLSSLKSLLETGQPLDTWAGSGHG